jgi:GT2 family glycosyltransferase
MSGHAAFDRPNDFPDTSIVMTTCSRSSMLRLCLESLMAQQTRYSFEIVVVDDGSTDDTAQLLGVLGQCSPVPFSVVAGPCVGVAAARNLAACVARGEWLVSFDDDQIALPGWLESLRSAADRTGAACVSGALTLGLPQGVLIESLGPRVRRVLGEHVLGTEGRRYAGRELPATNNTLVRADAFRALGGFDTEFVEGGEDTEFFSRLRDTGAMLWNEPEARALHITPADRLRRSNLRWTSLRLGASDVRLHRRKGTMQALRHAVVRTGLSVLRDLPQLVQAAVLRNECNLRNAQCSLWYTSGVLQATVAWAQSTPERSAFLRSLDFRSRNGERRTSAGTSSYGMQATPHEAEGRSIIEREAA